MFSIPRTLVARGRNYSWTTGFTVPIEVRVIAQVDHLHVDILASLRLLQNPLRRLVREAGRPGGTDDESDLGFHHIDLMCRISVVSSKLIVGAWSPGLPGAVSPPKVTPSPAPR
jgi:hypothetical protein